MSKHNETVSKYVAAIESKRPAIEKHNKLPAPDIVREAIAGIISSRDGRILKNAPRRAEKPIAHVLHKVLGWHKSTGNLWGVALLPLDCENIVESRGLECTGAQLYEQLDTLALVLLGGHSLARQNWQRALS